MASAAFGSFARGSTGYRLLHRRARDDRPGTWLHLTAEGAPVVAIDPDLDNARAQRAYRKAGFRDVKIVETEPGPALLMLFEGQ